MRATKFTARSARDAKIDEREILINIGAERTPMISTPTGDRILLFGIFRVAASSKIEKQN